MLLQYNGMHMTGEINSKKPILKNAISAFQLEELKEYKLARRRCITKKFK